MKNRDIIILTKILQYCAQVGEAMEMFNSDYEVFITNSVFQNSCCMCVLQIGELTKVVSDECKARNYDVPWREWCGIRDVFAHQYSNLDVTSAWETLKNDIQILKRRCKEILDEISESTKV